MVEAVAVNTAKQILGKLIDKADQYFVSDDAIKEKLQRLRNWILPKLELSIQVWDKASIEKMEPWLREFKLAVYEAEDLLDELEYDAIERSIENESEEKVSCFAPVFDPLIIYLKKMIKTAKNYVSSLGHKKKLSMTLDKLEMVAARADGFVKSIDVQIHINTNLKSNTADAIPWEDSNYRPTASSLTSPVFGRDVQRDELIDMLLSTGEDMSRPKNPGFHFKVIAIYAMAGSGKTTMAQYIYNDDRVTKYFDLRLWVHVSRDFDILSVTKKMIESAMETECPNMSNLDPLQEILRKSLRAKKFLLVLDDVWSDGLSSRDLWDKLLDPLNVGDRASAVLVTTRKKKTAVATGARPIVPLKELSSEDCWSIVEYFASNRCETIVDSKLVNVGKRIAARLKGSPLAGKMIGVRLGGVKNIDGWNSILEDDMLSSIMNILWASYNCLPPHLQPCFSYCSIFPKGWWFRVDDLIHLWMAQGFIHVPRSSELTVEKIGQKYFNELLSRCFFQHFDVHGQEIYIIHDLLHDLAEKVAIDDCYRIEGDQPTKIPRTVLHLYIHTSNLAAHIYNIGELSYLRTLYLIWITKVSLFDKAYLDAVKEMCGSLKRLRVLHVHALQTHGLLESVGLLKHLRYLATSYGTLPKSVHKLYQLQVLHVDRLPVGLSNLINLKHVNFRSFFIPPKIGKLTKIQKLEDFVVDKNKGCGLEQLKHLSELHGKLHIHNLENADDKAKAIEAKLKDKKYLLDLRLEWCSSERERSELDKDLEVLEGLEPPPSIEKLIIECYKGVKLPSWFNQNHCLSNLRILCLVDCPMLEYLPPLEQLPLLAELRICKAKAIKQFCAHDADSMKVFPRLKCLFLMEMENLKCWAGSGCDMMCPILNELYLYDCPVLMDDFRAPLLQKVYMKNCTQLTSSIWNFSQCESVEEIYS